MKLPDWTDVEWEPFDIWFARPNDTPILDWLICVVSGHKAMLDGSETGMVFGDGDIREERVKTFHCERCKRRGTRR